MAIAKVFFDSDALMAGSASRKGAAYILLQLSELGLIHGFISQDVVYECRKNLQKKLPEALPTFKQIVSKALTVVESPANKESVQYKGMAHNKDLPILTAAIKVKAQFLVTFNTKDFYPAEEFGLTVLAPGDLLREVRLRLSGLADEPRSRGI